MRLTAIQRARTFSPFQHADNDRLILEATARELERRGCRIDTVREEDVGEAEIRAAVVFSMAQGPRANAALDALTARGHLIVNGPDAVRNCYRQNLYPLLGEGCPLVPRTRLVFTDEPGDLSPLFAEGGALWVKRGDVHSTGDGDVVKVESLARCHEVLADFRSRQIHVAALQQHRPGQVVKFYGVVGTPFFRFYAETSRKVSPVGFGLFRQTIETVVRRMGLQIYGGDAVLCPDGTVKVIDINDWPSFANFRAEAAEAIAARIFQLALSHDARAAQRPRAQPPRI